MVRHNLRNLRRAHALERLRLSGNTPVEPCTSVTPVANTSGAVDVGELQFVSRGVESVEVDFPQYTNSHNAASHTASIHNSNTASVTLSDSSVETKTPVIWETARCSVTMAATTDSYILQATSQEPIASFSGASILIEAGYYLQQLIDVSPPTEPLLAALGGFPLVLESSIEHNLAKWKEYGMTPTFVFDGQPLIGREEVALRSAREAASRTQAAWGLYSRNQAPQAVVNFGVSGAVKVENFYTFFQRILVAKKIKFIIAPYNACAQIAYLDSKMIGNDAILSSTDILLYPLSDVCCLTEMDFKNEYGVGLIKSDLLKKLGVSEETFVDSLLMTGTSFVPTFPILKDPSIVPEQPSTIRDAINMYRASGRSLFGVCDAFDNDLKATDRDWKQKCLKAKMTLRHYVAIRAGGALTVSEEAQLTGDNHEYLGLRVPAELYHYMCSGTLRLRIIDWISSQVISVHPPLDGGEAEEYRKLVSEQLTPVREQGLALLVGRTNDGRMNRVFQFKNVEVKFWYDSTKTVKLDHMNVNPRPQDIVKKWNVKKSVYNSQKKGLKSQPGSIGFAILSLRDKDFAASTISNDEPSGIKDSEEILVNTTWRFLALRGYINEAHELTAYGEALAAVIEALGEQAKLDETAFLAVELLKYDQLNVRNRHEAWVGSALRGSDEDKSHCLLIARCASLLKLRHKAIGYTGPLSKNLLAFSSITEAVRESDRELVEEVFAAMFMYGHADRFSHGKWEDLGLKLPFIDQVDTALGIAVKTFLDDHADPGFPEEERRKKRSGYAKDFLPHAINFPEDLDNAFKFFDAICAGVNVLGSKVADKKTFEGAKEYLDARRAGPYDPTKDGLTNGLSES